MHILQRWELATPLSYFAHFYVGGNDAFLFTRVGENFAVGIDDDASAIVLIGRFGSGAVDPNHIGKILDRPRLQERNPMMNALHRPIGNHYQQFRSAARSSSEDFRKPQVITNRRR